jgi:hypothetical protein
VDNMLKASQTREHARRSVLWSQISHCSRKCIHDWDDDNALRSTSILEVFTCDPRLDPLHRREDFQGGNTGSIPVGRASAPSSRVDNDAGSLCVSALNLKLVLHSNVGKFEDVTWAFPKHETQGFMMLRNVQSKRIGAITLPRRNFKGLFFVFRLPDNEPSTSL